MPLILRFSRQTLFCVIILVSVVIFTRIILVSNAPNMYFFDSYGYVNRALDFVHNGQINFGVGMPFILSLSFFLKLFSGLAPSTIIVQSVMVSFSVMTVLILYLIGKKCLGPCLHSWQAFLLHLNRTLSHSQLPDTTMSLR